MTKRACLINNLQHMQRKLIQRITPRVSVIDKFNSLQKVWLET